MFEQAYIAEFDQCVAMNVDAADEAKSKSSGILLAMPLALLRAKPDVAPEIVPAENAIFGDVWPGLAIACI
jgi:hypothetical protein